MHMVFSMPVFLLALALPALPAQMIEIKIKEEALTFEKTSRKVDGAFMLFGVSPLNTTAHLVFHIYGGLETQGLRARA